MLTLLPHDGLCCIIGAVGHAMPNLAAMPRVTMALCSDGPVVDEGGEED